MATQATSSPTGRVSSPSIHTRLDTSTHQLVGQRDFVHQVPVVPAVTLVPVVPVVAMLPLVPMLPVFPGKVLQEEGGWDKGGLQGHWWRLLGLSLVLMHGWEVEVAAREQRVTLHLVS